MNYDQHIQRDLDSGRLAAILGVLDAFDWETGDRQAALEKIEQIAITSRVATGVDIGGSAVILPGDLVTLRQALGDALMFRDQRTAGWCPSCRSADDMCPACVTDFVAISEYEALAAVLGIEVAR